MRFDGLGRDGKEWIEVGMRVSVRRAERIEAVWMRLSKSQGAVSDGEQTTGKGIYATD